MPRAIINILFLLGVLLIININNQLYVNIMRKLAEFIGNQDVKCGICVVSIVLLKSFNIFLILFPEN